MSRIWPCFTESQGFPGSSPIACPSAMSGIWPGWCPEYGQFSLSIFRTSLFDVRNMASFHSPYSGPYLVPISDIIVHIPDINVLIPDINFMKNSMSGIWTGKTGHIPDIKSWCPEYGQWKLAIFRTSKSDVRNMASKNWPYSGHQFLMCGIWTVFTDHIPDIDLAIFRTSHKGGLGILIRQILRVVYVLL